MLALAATVAGGTGMQAPTLTPAGRPVTEHVAAVAVAVAVRTVAAEDGAGIGRADGGAGGEAREIRAPCRTRSR